MNSRNQKRVIPELGTEKKGVVLLLSYLQVISEVSLKSPRETIDLITVPINGYSHHRDEHPRVSTYHNPYHQDVAHEFASALVMFALNIGKFVGEERST